MEAIVGGVVEVLEVEGGLERIRARWRRRRVEVGFCGGGGYGGGWAARVSVAASSATAIGRARHGAREGGGFGRAWVCGDAEMVEVDVGVHIM